MLNRHDKEIIELTRNRGFTYGLLARLFREEVSPELLEQLRRKSGSLFNSKAAGEGQHTLTRFLRAMETLEPDQIIIDLASDFAGLFLNAGDHPAHPYESVYASPERLLMQEARDQVRQAYADAGLGRSEKWHEPEDHISMEMEFMSHLCFRTSAAIEKEDFESAHLHNQAQLNFLEQHLLLWVPQFCGDLIGNATTDFYRALGFLVRDFLRFERETVHPPGL